MSHDCLAACGPSLTLVGHCSVVCRGGASPAEATDDALEGAVGAMVAVVRRVAGDTVASSVQRTAPWMPATPLTSAAAGALPTGNTMRSVAHFAILVGGEFHELWALCRALQAVRVAQMSTTANDSAVGGFETRIEAVGFVHEALAEALPTAAAASTKRPRVEQVAPQQALGTPSATAAAAAANATDAALSTLCCLLYSGPSAAEEARTAAGHLQRAVLGARVEDVTSGPCPVPSDHSTLVVLLLVDAARQRAFVAVSPRLPQGRELVASAASLSDPKPHVVTYESFGLAHARVQAATATTV